MNRNHWVTGKFQKPDGKFFQGSFYSGQKFKRGRRIATLTYTDNSWCIDGVKMGFDEMGGFRSDWEPLDE